jgi:hypothetical protein
MFVFLTHLVNCCLSNLLSDGPLPPSIPVCFASVAYIHGKYQGGGWSLVDLRNMGPYFLNRDRHGRRNFADTKPLMSSLLVIFV